VGFLILQFFQLSAHDKEPLLGIQSRVEGGATRMQRHFKELVLHLRQMSTKGGIALREL